MKINRSTITSGGFTRQIGMTLVEVMIALTITGLVVVGVVKGYYFCTNAAERGALALAANARAMERIEEVRSAQWITSIFPGVDTLVSTNFPSKQVILDLTGNGASSTTATVTAEISQISDSPPVRKIHVDCIWQFNKKFYTNSVETCRGPDQ